MKITVTECKETMAMQQRKVWDLFVRIFHWGLLAAFVISYVTEDDFPTLHVYSGYTIAALILMRLVWGVIGTRHARFRDFVVRPSVAIAYAKDILRFRAERFSGHNPAGGMMVIALLASLSITLVFGLLTYGAAEFSGPLAPLVSGVDSSVAHFFEEIHEFFANFTLFLVVLHVAGVMLACFQHNENLVKSMITGYKQTDPDDKQQGVLK